MRLVPERTTTEAPIFGGFAEIGRTQGAVRWKNRALAAKKCQDSMPSRQVLWLAE